MTGKRRFGAVRKLPSGRYQVRYTGPDGITRPAPHTFRTKTDADIWLTQTETAIHRDDWINPDAGQEQLGAYATSWVAERPKLRPTTRRRYACLVRRHIAPYLGHLAVAEVRERHIRRWHQQRAEQGVSGGTLAAAYRVLKSIFNTAIEDELIRRNPCRIKGAGAHTAQERPVLTVTQVLALVEAMPARYRALVLLATFASLRWGELVGLRRRNIDLARCVIKVETTTVELDGQFLHDQPPKSTAGIRTVAIPVELVPALTQHLAIFVPDSAAALVFTSARGKVLRRGNFRRVWQRVLCQVELDSFRFHDLRHTGNTLAAQTGATLRELMNRMGHSSVRAALIYQHAAADRDRDIANALGRLIQQASSPSGTQLARRAAGQDR
jgi:integrase